MSTIAVGLFAITGLFGLLLVLKNTIVKHLKFCAICLAISLTWSSLLVLYWLDAYNDQLLIGILIGQSSLGIYYLLEKHAAKSLLIFRLPVLLTLILAVYSVLSKSVALDALATVAIVWLVVGLMYFYRSNSALKAKVKAFIDCCSDW